MTVIKNVNITLRVTRCKIISDAIFSVYFERPALFDYAAGDWIDLAKPGQILKGGKTFSLSSSPTEPELAITFRRGFSPFKQQLQTAQPGDIWTITQYGNDYKFYQKVHKQSVCIAGGIGIAPFRSMIKDMYDTKDKTSLQLLYFNKGADFLFSDEIDHWAKSLHLDVHYLDTTVLKRKQRLRIYHEVMDQTAHHYFIAGPEAMVEHNEHILIDLGINPKDIRIDSFGRYA